MKGCFLSLSLILYLSKIGFGQPVEYNVYTLNVNLSKGLIKSISVDNQGFIWCATDEGVVRYDGRESRFFKDELTGGFAKAFCKRENGALLVLHDLGLTEIESRSDTTWFRKLCDGKNIESDTLLYYPKTIYEDKKGNIWIGENQSIVKFKDGEFEKFRFNINSEYGIIFRTFAFAEDTNGNLWTISHNGQLFRFDFETNQFEEKKLSNSLNSVNDLQFGKSGYLYAGTESGLYQIEIDLKKEIQESQKIQSPKFISCGLIVNENEYFVGTWDNGLYRADLTKEILTFEQVQSLPFNDIWGLFLDEKNGLWVTGNEQTSVLSPVLFKTPKLREPNLLKSIQLMDDGGLISANDNFIVKNKKNGHSWIEEFSLYIPEQPPIVAVQNNDLIWFGDLLGQVFFFDLNKNQTQKIDAVQTSPQSIQDIHVDKKGNIWIAGNTTHGLIRISKKGLVFFYNQSGLQGSRVVMETKDGRLFAGGDTADGYLFEYKFDLDKFINLSPPFDFSISANFCVEDMLEVDSNKIWLATFDGVIALFLDENKVHRIDLQKVPIDEPSNSLAKSSTGTIWVGTTSGLIGYSEENSVLFNKSSGLPGNNFSNQGILIDQQNNLFIATPNGLGFVEEKDLNRRITPPPIIREIKIDGTRQLVKEVHHTIFPHQTNFEVEYLALSFPVEEVNYQTRVLGLDSTWSSTTSNTNFLWTALSAGDFTFQIRAQQKSGMLWSYPVSLKFSISLPWYQKWWVISLLIFGSMLLFYWFARLYNFNLIRQKKQLESIIKERTKQISDQKNEIIEQNKNYRLLQEKQFEDKLKYKNKQLTTFTLHLIQKNEALKELQTKIYTSMRTTDKSSFKTFKSLLETIDYSFRNDDEWEKFQLFFEEVHAGFFENLKSNNHNITAQDLRHCALIRLNLSITEVATIMGISSESVKTSRFRLRKKMDINSQQELVDYIMKI
jgi:ligand-binding sensor domain-containing protein/DNA-binding CsgD family transcriptional regulator